MKRNRLLAFVGFATILLLLTSSVWAQSVNPRDPESILAWLKLQGVGVSLVVTILWKYLPVVRGWSNLALPWLTLAGWVVAQTAGVGVANAAPGDVVVAQSLLHKFAIGVFNSAVSKALWDGWLKPTLGSWLDRELRRAPQTP